MPKQPLLKFPGPKDLFDVWETIPIEDQQEFARILASLLMNAKNGRQLKTEGQSDE